MAPDKMNDLVKTLVDLRRLEDVYDAFVVTSSGNRYAVPDMPSKIQNLGLLTLLNSTMANFIALLNRLYPYKAERIVVELQDLLVFIYSIDPTTVLVCIVPSLTNIGLLEVEIENARRKIQKIIS